MNYSEMKISIKDVVLGGLWGVISMLFIIAGTEEMASVSSWYYIITAPSWLLAKLGVAVLGKKGGVLFLGTPIVGSLIGAGLGFLIEKWKRKK